MINNKYSDDSLVSQPTINKENFLKKEVNVLMIEDNQLIQLIHNKILTDLGCQVDIASSGEEALLMIENHYDLILLDIGLPGISGTDVAIKFRGHKNHKEVRMIALTSHSDVDTRKLCFCSGIEEVLNKPIDIKKLETVIYQLKKQYFFYTYLEGGLYGF